MGNDGGGVFGQLGVAVGHVGLGGLDQVGVAVGTGG